MLVENVDCLVLKHDPHVFCNNRNINIPVYLWTASIHFKLAVIIPANYIQQYILVTKWCVFKQSIQNH